MPPDPSVPKRAADTSDTVYQRLLAAIITGDFPPGTPLREAHLANIWGVSRTPVREAVRRAATVGLLELRPNQRPLIRTLTATDLTQLYEVRSLLELQALKSSAASIPRKELEGIARQIDKLDKRPRNQSWLAAALELDETLHMLWIRHCQNPWLRTSIDQIWIFFQIFRRIVAKDKHLAEQALGEHRDITVALLAGETKEAVRLLKKHLNGAAALARQRQI